MRSQEAGCMQGLDPVGQNVAEWQAGTYLASEVEVLAGCSPEADVEVIHSSVESEPIIQEVYR